MYENGDRAYRAPGSPIWGEAGRCSSVRRPGTLAAGVLLLVSVACSDSSTTPISPDPSASIASAMNSQAPFVAWHQGFNHGTEGWYGSQEPGPLGWCGTVEQIDRESGAVNPSAGTGYAEVTQDSCNAFWAGIFGPVLVNGPWAPGPDFALFSQVWPPSGFVTELDIYLDPGDPSYAPAAPDPPFVNFFAPPGTVFTYAASLHDLSSSFDAFGSFIYFAVPVYSNDGKLSIFGHEVTEPGWYTFRHVFTDDGGQLSVDFELADRRGGTIFVEPILGEFFTGIPTSAFTPADFGSGYNWFVRIAHGLELPIDEHWIRPGG